MYAKNNTDTLFRSLHFQNETSTTLKWIEGKQIIRNYHPKQNERITSAMKMEKNERKEKGIHLDEVGEYEKYVMMRMKKAEEVVNNQLFN